MGVCMLCVEPVLKDERERNKNGCWKAQENETENGWEDIIKKG